MCIFSEGVVGMSYHTSTEDLRINLYVHLNIHLNVTRLPYYYYTNCELQMVEYLLTLRIRSSSSGPGKSLWRSRPIVLSSQFDTVAKKRWSPPIIGGNVPESVSFIVEVGVGALHKCVEITQIRRAICANY